jgi:hypothetical protein
LEGSPTPDALRLAAAARLYKPEHEMFVRANPTAAQHR